VLPKLVLEFAVGVYSGFEIEHILSAIGLRNGISGQEESHPAVEQSGF
jgi:hypothetical protein